MGSSGHGSSGLGSTGSASSGTSSGLVSGGSSNNLTPSTQGGSTAHCDRLGYPSCSSLGSEAGKKAVGVVVLQVTARLFVVHIMLQQDHPLLLPSQALPPKKGILQQAQSGIRPHRSNRQMLHIAINQPIRLAIVWALRMAKAI